MRVPGGGGGGDKHRVKIDAFLTYKDDLMHSLIDNIINMDETPVYMNNPSKRTVHFVTVPRKREDPVMVKTREGNHRARVTVMLSCTASGKLLDPCIVEAGKSNHQVCQTTRRGECSDMLETGKQYSQFIYYG